MFILNLKFKLEILFLEVWVFFPKIYHLSIRITYRQVVIWSESLKITAIIAQEYCGNTH